MKKQWQWQWHINYNDDDSKDDLTTVMIIIVKGKDKVDEGDGGDRWWSECKSGARRSQLASSLPPLSCSSLALI